jgi:hypothetical protein
VDLNGGAIVTYSRRNALAIFGAATAAATLSAAVPARAASQPYLRWYLDRTDNDGRIAVSAVCPVPIVAIKARILSSRAGSELAAFTLFDRLYGADLDGVWQSRDRVLLPQLGTYWIMWEVHSADGGVVIAEREFAYWLRILFSTPLVDRDFVDVRHRKVNLACSASKQHPGTLEAFPAVGIPIGVNTYYPGLSRTETVPVEVAADGSFQAELTLDGSAHLFATTLEPAPGDFFFYSTSEVNMMRAVSTPTRVTARVADTPVDLGKTTEVSGLLEEFYDGVWSPLPNRKVAVTFQTLTFPGPTEPLHVATTDQNGRFVQTVTPPGYGLYEVWFNQTFEQVEVEAFYELSWTRTDPVAPRRSVIISELRVATPWDTSKYGLWEIRGTTDPTLESGTVQIQRRADSGEWETIAIAYDDSMVGSNFMARVTLTNSCYLRAFVPGTEYLVPSASPVFYLNVLPLRPSPEGGRPPLPGVGSRELLPVQEM